MPDRYFPCSFLSNGRSKLRCVLCLHDCAGYLNFGGRVVSLGVLQLDIYLCMVLEEPPAPQDSCVEVGCWPIVWEPGLEL